MIDTHCHLYAEEFKVDIDEVIQKARNAGVEKFFLPAIDNNTHKAMMNIETLFPGECFAMMGLHPCSVKEDYKTQLSLAENWLSQRKFIAIGETGLDFYWDKTFVKEQYHALEMQIEWALHYELPIVLHTRDAMQETINVIKANSAKGLTGVFHCFGGTLDEAMQIIDTGFLLGIGGVVTYKKAGLESVLNEIELKHLVLETDAPYLSPVPYRGKRNESSYLKLIAEKIAEIKSISPAEVNRITTENANRVFNTKI